MSDRLGVWPYMMSVGNPKFPLVTYSNEIVDTPNTQYLLGRCLQSAGIDEWTPAGRDPRLNIRGSDWTYEYWSYIQFTQAFNDMYIVLKEHELVNPGIDVYAVTSAWDHTTISWNNKPTLGALLGTNHASYGGGEWHRIPASGLIDVPVNGVCLRPRLSDTYLAFFGSNYNTLYVPDGNVVAVITEP